jgi:hypothetical protein
MKLIISKTLLLSAIIYSSTALSCFYFPPSYKNSIDGTQDVFLFHDGENAHMVIRATLQAKKFPTQVAWILPFPSLPSKYEEISGPVFEGLSDILQPIDQNAPRTKGAGTIGGRGAGIKAHESITLDQYVIQPIEILKDNSTKELNAWLKKNNFKITAHSNQKAYLKKGAALLAIRMELNQPNANELVSHSLHITYRSDRLSVPLRFMHIGRTLDLNLYVFSQREMKKDLGQFYLSREASQSYENQRLKPFVDSLLLKQKGFITQYSGQRLNSKTKRLEKLQDDPFFLLTELR